MADEKPARRYAAAIFQLASERNAVESVGRDLHAIAEALYEEESARGFFLSPVVERSEKERVLAQAFDGKADEIALHSLLLLVRKRRERLLQEIVRQYDAMQLQARGEEPLTITSARPLTRDEQRALVAKLERIYGRKFDVRQQVDPELIGGVRVLMGDRRVDGTVEGRLSELARTLFTRN
jgi:F-type H+-transporting ATPase subunit delta